MTNYRIYSRPCLALTGWLITLMAMFAMALPANAQKTISAPTKKTVTKPVTSGSTGTTTSKSRTSRSTGTTSRRTTPTKVKGDCGNKGLLPNCTENPHKDLHKNKYE